MQLDLFAASDLAQLQEELFEAYFACRRNKRNTPSALAFERHFESRIFSLADEMFDGRWRPQPSTAFIVSKPVKREVFANFYLHALDEFIKEDLGFTRYGRYVDDFFIVEGSKHQLKNAVGRIEAFLKQELALKLHPNKRWLQHATKGVAFLGAVVWPSHTTVGKRIKGNFYTAIDEVNHDPALDAHAARQRLNSYLGIMRHHRSHRLRHRGLRVRLKCSARVHFRIARDCSRVRLRVA